MKSLIALACLSCLTPFASARADEPDVLECINGPRDQVGDAFFGVTVFEDGLEVTQWESSYAIDPEFVTYTSGLNGWVMTIDDAVVTISGEGETWTAKKSGVLILDTSSLTMSVALSTDDSAPMVQTLACRARPVPF